MTNPIPKVVSKAGVDAGLAALQTVLERQPSEKEAVAFAAVFNDRFENSLRTVLYNKVEAASREVVSGFLSKLFGVKVS